MQDSKKWYPIEQIERFKIVSDCEKIKFSIEMSQFAPAPSKPDSRIFASYPMPAKIDLINERPRRESLIEKQLENTMGSSLLPKIEISEQPIQYATSNHYNQQSQSTQGSQQEWNHHSSNIFYTQQQRPSPNAAYQQQHLAQQKFNQQQQQMVQPQSNELPRINNQVQNVQTTATTVTTTTASTRSANNAAILAADLAEKEAKLMAEINALHQRPYSPFQVPAKIDLTNEQRIAQQQFEHAPSPRPYSRASSTKSTSADLMDKEAKLLQEIDEMEKKPFNPQTMVVEREQWFEYPEGRPHDKHLTDSKRRIKDFCSLPSHMYPNQGTHVHEENLPATSLGRPSSAANSIHTTIIRSPRREVDNKSPLPFAFDNFSTKGVRGNIASVGAIEPDRPRPPIYPIIKRSPSPNFARS